MHTQQGMTQYYQSMGKNAHVLSAEPHQLVSMLIKQGRNKINLAIHAGQQDIGTRSQSIHRACAIVDALRVSLDTHAGGEIAQNLEDLYDYMHRRLMHANIQPEDSSALTEVDQLLSTLQDAWEQIESEAAGA
ncbi:MAG: flagellar export chaperone FliS [Salinisphaeraceae bacterium]|nr:flagellar export chaperone FliS [Salinisphaeraceae bacterium]